MGLIVFFVIVIFASYYINNEGFEDNYPIIARAYGANNDREIVVEARTKITDHPYNVDMYYNRGYNNGGYKPLIENVQVGDQLIAYTARTIDHLIPDGTIIYIVKRSDQQTVLGIAQYKQFPDFQGPGTSSSYGTVSIAALTGGASGATGASGTTTTSTTKVVTGPAGPAGPVGPAGPKGNDGAIGPTGPAGAPYVSYDAYDQSCDDDCSFDNCDDSSVPQRNDITPDVSLTNSAITALALKHQMDAIRDFQKNSRNEMISNRCTDPLPSGNCPDMSNYIKKDSIPCYNCSLDY